MMESIRRAGFILLAGLAAAIVMAPAPVFADFSIRETKSDTGVVREFVSSSGKVFGITWSGLSHPDLGPLLGPLANEYHDALNRHPRRHGRRHQSVKTGRVVVEKWGHMRKLGGRAYIPSLLPEGVSPDEIK